MLDANSATGNAKTEPTILPSNDIWIVSTIGFQTFSKYVKSGGNIFIKISKKLSIFLKNIPISTLVNIAAAIETAIKIKIIIGVIENGSITSVPDLSV